MTSGVRSIVEVDDITHSLRSADTMNNIGTDGSTLDRHTDDDEV